MTKKHRAICVPLPHPTHWFDSSKTILGIPSHTFYHNTFRQALQHVNRDMTIPRELLTDVLQFARHFHTFKGHLLLKI